jgi:hypothetical protein
MVWPGSQTVCADVAVTVAVNPDHTPTAHLLDYAITAGHSHGPPATINGQAADGHTYYVLAGNTPVLVHNTNCPELFKPHSKDGKDGLEHVKDEHMVGGSKTQGNTVFSQYLDEEDVCDLICDTVRTTTGRRNTGTDLDSGLPRDGTIHEKDYGYPIGQAGETGVRVIVNPDGTLRTAMPT